MRKNWEIKKIGSVCRVIAGQSPEGKFYNNNGDGLAFYQGKKEYGEKYIGAPTTWTTKITKVAEEGDILMSVRAPVGPINLATQKICIGRGLASIRVTNQIDREFLYYFLLKHENEIVGNTGAVFNSINKTQIEEIEIPLPSLAEQQHIVAVLDEALAKIDKAKNNVEQNLKNAKELYQAYLDNVFGNGSWKSIKLEEFYEITSSKRVFKSEWKKEGVPFYRAREIVKLAKLGFVKNDLFISEDMYNRYAKKYGIPKENDIMITGVGTLGICYVVRKNDKFYFKDGNIIWLKTKNNINSRFIEYAFKTNFIRNQINDGLGATVGTFTIIKANNTCIPTPSITEQGVIVKKLDLLRDEVKKIEKIYEHRLKILDELKKCILQKAFTGELRQIDNPAIIINVSPFILNQVNASIIERVVKDGGQTTEVAVAKYNHLLQELCGLSLGYQFEKQLFGPFDAKIKRLMYSGLGKNKWFEKKNGMIVPGKNVNALLSKKSNLYQQAQSAMDELSRLKITKLDVDKIELLSTICHSIKEIKSIEIEKIINFMSGWKTDKNKTKAEKFSRQSIENCLKFITDNELYLKLI